MTETITYGRVCKEDVLLEPRDAAVEVTLADGRVVVLHALDVAYLLADAYTRATLPATAVTGTLARVTDEDHNIVLWTGSAWVSVTKITTAGDLVYGAASGVPTRLAVGGAGALLSVASGLPAWLALGTAGHVLTAGASAPAWAFPYYHGQCRLTSSGANLLLSPLNGNRLLINSVVQTIPDAGVTLAPTSLAVNTTYFIYAFMNAGTLTLEASTTAHATQAGTGIEIKSGDATRTLVGMARTITGPAWQDAAAQRFVLTYFNRRLIGGSNAFEADRSTSSLSYVEIDTTARAEFLTWGDEAVSVAVSGASFTSTAGASDTSIGIDDTTAEDAYTSNTSTNRQPVGLAVAKNGLAEGYHYATILGRVTANTGTWEGAATAGERTAIHVTLRG